MRRRRATVPWQAERTRRLPREDFRAEVGEDVRVGPMEFKLYTASLNFIYNSILATRSI